MKRQKKLSADFKPTQYKLVLPAGQGLAQLKLTGRKTGRPSRRITLHQRKLKIISAKIRQLDKLQEISLIRINHLHSFEEVRLHTKEMLFPGEYEIELDYKLPANFDKNNLNRSLVPSIDEPPAWAGAEIKR